MEISITISFSTGSIFMFLTLGAFAVICVGMASSAWENRAKALAGKVK